MIIFDGIFGENAVAKIRKVECRAKRTGFFFYAETQYLRHALAKIRKVECRAKRIGYLHRKEK